MWREPLPESSHPGKSEEPCTRTASAQTRAQYKLTLKEERKRSPKPPNGHTRPCFGAQASTAGYTACDTNLCTLGGLLPDAGEPGDRCGHTQTTQLHPHSMTEAVEMGPWGGSGILVSRGPGSTWATFQSHISFEYFYPWHSSVTQPPGSFSVATVKGGREAGCESRWILSAKCRVPLDCPLSLPLTPL